VRGMIAAMRGDIEVMARNFTEVYDLHASLGNDAGMVSAAINLAEFEHARGEPGKAIEIAKSETARAARLPSRDSWAFLVRNLAGYLLAVDDIAGGRDAARDALSFYASEGPDGPYAAIALEHLALSYALDGDFRRAAAIEGYVQRSLQQHGFRREYTERTSHDRLQQMLGANLEDHELAELLSRGERMEVSDLFAAAEITRYA
jgi:ATP/maltotriose-dependent transcriptional regulator MalT